MSQAERFDIIIFGASGYSGRIVVQELMKLNQNNSFTWAVAGRNESKLKEVLALISTKTGQDLAKIPIIIADCADEVSLITMTSRARAVINCCGPYRFFGEPVIKACIATGTHHLDVSGEPEYMEKVQLNYGKDAEERGVYIVSACGFDGVPADFGVFHLTENFPGVVNSVESYLEYTSQLPAPSANFGTWASTVHSIANVKNLKPIRRILFAALNGLELKPRLESKPVVHKSPVFNNKYSLWFPASDRSVVLRTQQFMYTHYKQRPIQYWPYYICTVGVMIKMMMMAFFLLTLSKFEFGRKLLLGYPEFFSGGLMAKEGPPEEVRVKTLACFRFKGEGWSQDIADKFEDKTCIPAPMNKNIVTEMSFPDCGYGFAARFVILSTFTVLNESDCMPLKGGVYTPGAAFTSTSFSAKLPEIGVTFKVLSKD